MAARETKYNLAIAMLRRLLLALRRQPLSRVTWSLFARLNGDEGGLFGVAGDFVQGVRRQGSQWGDLGAFGVRGARCPGGVDTANPASIVKRCARNQFRHWRIRVARVSAEYSSQLDYSGHCFLGLGWRGLARMARQGAIATREADCRWETTPVRRQGKFVRARRREKRDEKNKIWRNGGVNA